MVLWCTDPLLTFSHFLVEAMWKLKQLRTCIEPIRNEGLEAHVQTCAGSTDTCDQASTDALYFHWKRTCWVLDMWGQADRNVTVLEPVTEYGWTVEDRNLCITWDTDENMKTVRERVSLLLRGCKCVTGCKNKRRTPLQKGASVLTVKTKSHREKSVMNWRDSSSGRSTQQRAYGSGGKRRVCRVCVCCYI